jgi:hypothetical protein
MKVFVGHRKRNIACGARQSGRGASCRGGF